MTTIGSVDWAATYAEAADLLMRSAASAAPVIGLSTANVDRMYFMSPARLAAIVRMSQQGEGPVAELASRITDRVQNARGGTITVDWPDGPATLLDVLGEPDRLQVGGAMPQAAWALSELDVATCVPLADRSAEQLSVMDPRIGLIHNGSVVPLAEVPPSRDPGKPPHVVLEFTAGVEACGLTVTRSTRLVVLFGRYGLERDEQFATAIRNGTFKSARAALISGLAFADPANPVHFDWVRENSRALRKAGVETVHHELTEFPDDEAAARIIDAVSANSIGVNLSELQGSGEIGLRAVQLAERARAERVIIHADDWAMSVHRGDPYWEQQALLAGATLASARAREGHPTRDLHIAPAAIFSLDIPAARPQRDGWRSTVVPTPYLRNPAATVGLGDTFSAGFLLHASA